MLDLVLTVFNSQSAIIPKWRKIPLLDIYVLSIRTFLIGKNELLTGYYCLIVYITKIISSYCSFIT